MRTSFASGELDPALLGRVDLRAHEDGAFRLRNVIVQSTGGVSRRGGTRIVGEFPGASRLVAFDDAQGARLVAIGADLVRLVRGEVVEGEVVSVWTADQLRDLNWTRYGDSLLLCHPAVAPQRLSKGLDQVWQMGPWTFDSATSGDDGTHYRAPFVKFAPSATALRAFKDGAASGYAPKAGDNVVLQAGAPVFDALHYGAILCVKGRQVRVTSYMEANLLQGLALEDLVDDKPTLDWQEEAFSRARGYPRSLTFHQDRLVIGGARDLPDWVWMSRTGRPFDFDPGTGLDDEAIVFRVSADGYHEITQVFAGRQLQVFSTFGEWTVKGVPLTPMSIEVAPQTRVGSPSASRVRPVDVDGATLFIGASRKELREFLFTDAEQAYQAADIATLSRHLLEDPIDMAFDGSGRQLWIVRGDGRVATVTIDRNANVAAWSLQELEASVRAVAVVRGAVMLLVESQGRVFLEVVDPTISVDHALIVDAAQPTISWAGLELLAGRTVTVLADGRPIGELVVGPGTLATPEPARRLTLGQAFEHRIEPMPPAVAVQGVAIENAYRPTRVTFRVMDSTSLVVDTGRGVQVIGLPTDPVPRLHDATIQAYGWRRGVSARPWQVVDAAPFPFTLLAVQTDIKVND